MIIIPAIDIKDGKVVRLVQGRFDEVTEYSDDPVKVAQHWESQGAQRLHLVDLDGAKTGKISNFSAIADITASINIPVEMGGGVREIEDIQKLFSAGVSFAILGTRSVENRDFLKSVLAEFDAKIIISLDSSNGKVAQRGWTEISDVNTTDFAKELENLGVRCFIYTDIARDGMLTGPNFDGINEILDTVNTSIIASGGISSIEDIKKLVQLKSKGLIGAITGKAIYEGKLDFKEAVQLCSQSA